MERGGVDSLLGEADLLLLVVCGLEARGVNGRTTDTNFFTVVGDVGSGRIDGGLVGTETDVA